MQAVQDLLRRGQMQAVDLAGYSYLAILAQEFGPPLHHDQSDQFCRSLFVVGEAVLPPQRRTPGAGLGAVDARVADDESFAGDPAALGWMLHSARRLPLANQLSRSSHLSTSPGHNLGTKSQGASETPRPA